MKSYQVIRTHTSPYQAADFHDLERKTLQNIAGVNYRLLSEADINAPSILITNTHTQLNELPSELIKQTKLILHPNSGYDHFRAEHELWEDIPLVIGHEIRAQAVAEYSLSCLFQGKVELPQHLSWLKERTWERSLLSGSEVWIFGYGHIGKIIAQTLSALGVNITIIDPFTTSPYCHFNRWQEGNLKSAQVVIAACSLNETSHHLFNQDFFQNVRGDLLFINGARGKLVEEKALKEFLPGHPEAFAFLDVFEKEPFGQEWHHMPQVWKTSHIAGVTLDLDQKIIAFEVKVLNDFLHLSSTEFGKKYKNELLQNKWQKGVLI